MTTEKLSKLPKVTLLAVTGLDSAPGQLIGGCIPDPALHLCKKTVASLRLMFLYLSSKMDSWVFFFLMKNFYVHVEFFKGMQMISIETERVLIFTVSGAVPLSTRLAIHAS